MKLKNLFKREYMSWKDYSKRVALIDCVMFIDDTARQSLKNICSRQKRKRIV